MNEVNTHTHAHLDAPVCVKDSDINLLCPTYAPNSQGPRFPH